MKIQLPPHSLEKFFCFRQKTFGKVTISWQGDVSKTMININPFHGFRSYLPLHSAQTNEVGSKLQTFIYMIVKP